MGCVYQAFLSKRVGVGRKLLRKPGASFTFPARKKSLMLRLGVGVLTADAY